MILSVCESPDVLKVMQIVNIVIKIIRIVVPIILIIAAAIRLTRAVEDGELAKATKTVLIEVVAVILIFMIPTFVKIIANALNGSDVYEECLREVSDETIVNAYKKTAEKLVSRAEKTLLMMDYNTALGYLNNLSKEDREPYLRRLDVVKAKIDAAREKEKPVTPTTLTGTIYGETGSYTFDNSGDKKGYSLLTVQGTNYRVVKSYLQDYQSYIKRARVYQAADKENWGSSCLGFSYTHSWGLYTNNKSYTGNDGMNYVGGGHFTKFIDSDFNKISNILYNELLNGRPVVIQVNGNTNGTSRHFVSAVGVKSSVASGSSLKQEDLLIIDSWDGNLEKMEGSNARFFTTGAACKKNYKGYYILYMRPSSR